MIKLELPCQTFLLVLYLFLFIISLSPPPSLSFPLLFLLLPPFLGHFVQKPLLQCFSLCSVYSRSLSATSRLPLPTDCVSPLMWEVLSLMWSGATGRGLLWEVATQAL